MKTLRQLTHFTLSVTLIGSIGSIGSVIGCSDSSSSPTETAATSGSGGQTTSTPGGGAGGNSATSGAGGGGAAGTGPGTGGKDNSSGAGGAADLTCSPTSGFGDCGIDCVCTGYDPATDSQQSAGLGGPDLPAVRSWKVAIVAGQSIAFSINPVSAGQRIRFWGSSDPCGKGDELLLDVTPTTTGPACYTLKPTADHAYLVHDFTRVSGGSTMHFCPTGTCPN